jgi:D-3-phosphoglycerate dehydrogenase / 2-oxoglutarate reductase
MTRAKKNILICDRFSVEAEIQLKAVPEFNVQKYSADALTTAHALVIRSKFKVTAEVLNQCSELQAIVTCTSGYDHIDLVETQKRNITVMYTPEANAISAAELTWALILNARKKVLAAHKEVKAGQWNRDLFLSNELAGHTLGVVGLGRIGSRVAKIANAFEMKVLAFDPYQTEENFVKANATRCSYEEVLKQADILTFHVPQTFETKNMFSRSQLEYVSPELILVNASRGQVVNEDDVVEALNNNKLRFAAFDVFAKEPLSRESKLLKCQNVLLTPHLGAYTEEAFLKASFEGAQRLTDLFLHQKTLNTLPLQNDWGSLSFSERT